jgi:hypothetical protein
MNCRNVRSEIEEAAPGKWFSADVNNHVLSCPACETLLREQTKLRELVSSLGTVEAPGDFDFRLRARLAEEKRARTQSFGLVNFSFGLGSAAVVTVLLLIGSGLMFISLKTRSVSPATAVANKTAPEKKGSDSVATKSPDIASESQANNMDSERATTNSVQTATLPKTNRHELNRSEVARQDSKKQRSQDSALTPAPLIKRDQLYATSTFPIDAGYQSLKVSVDDGRGVSRTISLPAVSFGSQSSLSQGTSPLMASARGAW